MLRSILLAHGISLSCLISPALPGEIHGVVHDKDGRPVRQANVIVISSETGFIRWQDCEKAGSSFGSDEVWADESRWATSVARTGAAIARTDKEGRFHFKGLRVGSFVLLAAHPEKGILIVRDLSSEANADNALTLILPPPTFVEGKISGYIKGKTGFWQRAEEMVHVNLDGDYTFSRLSPKRRDGQYALSLQPRTKIADEGTFRVGPLPCGGRMQLRITRWDGKLFQETVLLNATLDVPEKETTRFEYDLTANHVVSGTLRNEEGKPIADAAVHLDFTITEDNSLGVSRLGAVTDDKGRFAVRGVPPGTYNLSTHRMAGRSTAAQLGTACEEVQMEFKTEQAIVIGPDDSPQISIELTRADRERARAINKQQEGIAEVGDETISPGKWFEPAATGR